MSSHHFVKEGQEPALIIANGAECRRELMDQLLEWSPFVVVLDGALDRVLTLGIKFDVLLGDFDRLETAHPVVKEQPDVEIVHTPDQNKTDLEKALDFLISRNYLAANIIWATGLRMDHTFNNICTLGSYRDKIHAVLYDDHSRIFVLPGRYTRYYTKGQVISLFALGQVRGVSTKGLLYDLDHEDLHIVDRSGSSNECIETGIIEILHEDGILLLMECQD